jgi:hypothetical protein
LPIGSALIDPTTGQTVIKKPNPDYKKPEAQTAPPAQTTDTSTDTGDTTTDTSTDTGDTSSAGESTDLDNQIAEEQAKRNLYA